MDAAVSSLAVEVIAQALRDLHSSREVMRASAGDFLSGNDAFRFWCSVGGLNCEAAERLVKRAIEKNTRARRIAL